MQDLAQAGLFGRLADKIFLDQRFVLTRVSGKIDYAWTDSYGRSHRRSSPFSVDIPLLEFKTGIGGECGAGGPVERGYKTVKLSLDRKNYRIPLPFSGSLGPKQNRRLSLALVADKSSQHFFKVVLQLADGSTVSSPKVDLLYFMPRFAYTN
jgi:hypothetical protein